ncbi:MAG: TssN family type VI secretion system protein [Paludibacteraceae bacterium]|nr:hypothetical protein [Prevotellaceae bacterium]
MNLIFADLFKTYLLFPLLAFLLAAVVLFVAKKNKLLDDRKAIVFILVSCFVLSLPGFFGFLQVMFMPYTFLAIQLLYLLAGFVNHRLLVRYVKRLESGSLCLLLLFLFVQMLMAWALFSVWFNLTNDFLYGIWAGSSVCALLLVPLFLKTYESYLKIPLEIYKMRTYLSTDTFNVSQSSIDADGLLVCEIEVYRTVDEGKPIRIKAKSLPSMVLGDWFGLIVSDYNQKKSGNRIEINDSESPYGWIFYTKSSFFRPRRYMDPDLSFVDNAFVEQNLIVAKRVRKCGM